MNTSKKREEKKQGKYYFVRIREDSYKQIAKIADKEERSTNNMVNLLLREKLEEFQNSKKSSSSAVTAS